MEKAVNGQSYQTVNDFKATISFNFPQPDPMGCQFGGYVQVAGETEYQWWTPDGNCPRKPEYSLKAPWPTEDTRQYIPLIKQKDGCYRPIASYHGRMDTLLTEWKGKTPYAVLIETVNDIPTSTIVAL